MSELQRYRRAALVLGAVGAAATALGFFLDAPQFFRSYLWAYWFWTGIGIGCLQMWMLYQLTGGNWGFLTQRVMEAAARTIPLMIALILPLLFGVTRLFPWATAQGQQQYQHKAIYLNLPFFFVRLAVYFVVWTALVWFLSKWSRDDDDELYRQRRAAVSGPGIVLCTLAVAFAAIDWMMSLEPAWFSTIYPLLHAVGQVLAGLAVSILLIALLSRTRPISRFATPDTMQDLGNLMLAFTVLWAYIQFSQLLIVWMGNLPKEIIWYRNRLTGGWQYLALFLVVAHFFVPFALLLSRKTKRRARVLASVAAFILAMRVIDYFFAVEPAFSRGRFFVHWLDIAAPLGIGGIWFSLFLWRLSSRPLLPAHDPRVQEALENA